MAVLGGAQDCIIYSDELNHASIIDGVRLAKTSGATLEVYRHNDMHHLRYSCSFSSLLHCRSVMLTGHRELVARTGLLYQDQHECSDAKIGVRVGGGEDVLITQ